MANFERKSAECQLSEQTEPGQPRKARGVVRWQILMALLFIVRDGTPMSNKKFRFCYTLLRALMCSVRLRPIYFKEFSIQSVKLSVWREGIHHDCDSFTAND